MEPNLPEDSREQQLEAVFLYRGILDAYDAVGTELIGPNVLEEHVLPRMVYYVKEFLPEIFSKRAESAKLVDELRTFLKYFHKKVDEAQDKGSVRELTMNEIWQLRAAIFGYESVFINILGDAAIKDYVFVRMADILASYLPEQLLNPSISLAEKLQGYVVYTLRPDRFGGQGNDDTVHLVSAQFALDANGQPKARASLWHGAFELPVKV